MKATVQADGEDLVVTLPQELIDDLRLKPGDVSKHSFRKAL